MWIGRDSNLALAGYRLSYTDVVTELCCCADCLQGRQASYHAGGNSIDLVAEYVCRGGLMAAVVEELHSGDLLFASLWAIGCSRL